MSFRALGTGSGPAVLINIRYAGDSQDVSETGLIGPSCKLLTDGQRPGIDLGAVQFPGEGA